VTGVAGIEGGAEEVRLADLGRRGISRVRVLRPSDIERMIQGVLAHALVSSTREGEALVQATRDALLRRMRETQAQIAAADRTEAEIDRLRAANAKKVTELAEARARLAQVDVALEAAEAQAAALEDEVRELEDAISGDGAKVAAKLARERARLERESAHATKRLAAATASLEGGAALEGKVEELLAAAHESERRRGALEAELRSLGGEP